MLTIFAAVAELKRECILQRQREGIDIAKANGVYKGRKPVERSNFDAVVAQWRHGEIKNEKDAAAAALQTSPQSQRC